MNASLSGVLLIGISCFCFEAQAMPPPVVDVPDLLTRSDVVIAGRAEPPSKSETSEAARFINTLSVGQVIKGSLTPGVTPLKLRVHDPLIDGGDVAISMMYGLFFLKKEGDHYTPTDSRFIRVVAAPSLKNPFSSHATDLDKAAVEIAEVFTMSPDIVIARGSGLDFRGDYLLPVVTSSSKPLEDVSSWRVATSLNRAEQVYGEAAQALWSIPKISVTSPLLAIVDSDGPLVGRLFAFSCLLMKGDTSRLESFLPYLLHPSEDAPGTNAELKLGLISLERSETLVPTFAKLMRSTNERIREAAILKIKDSDSPEALSGIEDALHDEDFQVRLSAVFGVCSRTRACGAQNPTHMARAENVLVPLEIFHTWLAQRRHN